MSCQPHLNMLCYLTVNYSIYHKVKSTVLAYGMERNFQDFWQGMFFGGFCFQNFFWKKKLSQKSKLSDLETFE